MVDGQFDLAENPVHLGLGARVIRLDPMDGSMEWYERYGAQTADDGVEGRLVAMHTYSESWDKWEMHPNGDELAVCTAGSMRLHQEIDGKKASLTLHAGEAVINPRGVWHTADIDAPCTALFVTAGAGTQHRPR